MNEPVFETVFGTWVKLSDVENPDELVDPSDYYDQLSSFNSFYNDETDNYDTDEELESDNLENSDGIDQGIDTDLDDDGGFLDFLGDLF